MEGRGDHVAVAWLFQTPAVVPIAPQDFLWLPSPASPAPPVRAEQAEPAVYGAQQATGDLGSRLLVRAVVRAVHSCSRLRCKTREQDGRKEGFYLKEGRKEGGRKDLGSRLLVRAVVRAVYSCSRLRCKTREQDGRKEGFYLKEGRKEGGRKDLGSRLLVRAVVRAVHSCSRLRCKTREQDGRKEGFYLKEGRKEGRISALGFSYGPWSVQFTAVADFAAKHGNRMEGRKGFI